MKNITVGKFRALQQVSSSGGTFTCLALDHRQNLRKANPAFQSNIELSQFKMDVSRELASDATAILLDPEVSAAQVIASNNIPNNVGLVVAVESTGYTGGSTARKVQIIPGWSVEKTKRMGASAVKLLVYYHPDSSTSSEIEQFVKNIAAECKTNDIALMLEPLTYSLDNNRLSSEEKKYVVIETAKKLTPLGIDILKTEFPVDASEKDQSVWSKACEDLSSVSSVPWILLSAAVGYDTYLQQVIIGCNAGASGIAVGRAVWQEAVSLNVDERQKFLRTIGRTRLSRLTSLCHALARPWTDFYFTEVDFNWYKNY